MAEVTTVVHIEEWPIYRQGFASLVQETAEFSLVGSGSTLHDAIALAQNHKPHIVVLDINIAGNGLEAAKMISRQYPEVRIMFLTASERPDHILAAFNNGGLAYLRKNSDPLEILAGLRAVRQGKKYVSPALSARTISLDGRGDWIEQKFTAREADIVRLLTDGHTNREIAERLAISEKTVKHRVTDIMQKLQVRNRVEVTRAILRQLSES